ncbi:MAG: aconitate hydratase AcnA [Deltaproteobacteria bacterium]|uniref:aconitate hydratase AcnA n=1 Tax=Desulfobacula sp. TaxID=2593537 RepID=UPI0019B294CA|nr:aconitate hydratase AcnA [Candidatus Desulfobacula maris]MBL6994910.1 aconitate hydratase AcnA [Desulfobacula sp.]
MNPKDFIRQIKIKGTDYTVSDITMLQEKEIADIERLPFSIRILVENLLRKLDGQIVRWEDLENIAGWKPTYEDPVEIPYHPARVLMQDFTGVPAVVDLAAMRDAVKDLGGDPNAINPLVPVDLIIDHSVQIDFSGTPDALSKNMGKEFLRNKERYSLLKWAQQSFDNFKVVPPGSGICHQVNLEYLGQVITTGRSGQKMLAYPDTLVGTDSHTTMINGLGVLGWGVGGIEAEAVMLGQPYYMSIPEVIGVKMTGSLEPGITATDLVLTITERLRKLNVVEKFVEFFGPGMEMLNVPDRATVANMAPEYGATIGFFPVDKKTIEYLNMTNRKEQAQITEHYTKATGLFYTGKETPEYTKVIELDLSTVTPSIAGPVKPQERLCLDAVKNSFAGIIGCEYDAKEDVILMSKFHDESGCQAKRSKTCKSVSTHIYTVNLGEKPVDIGDGSIVIAAITSCTNTSNPSAMIGAGLLAKKAVEKGIKTNPVVKTSFAPGSRVVVDYLIDADLMQYLEALGFHVAGFGCTTCIGNSGPLNPEIEKAIVANELTVASVLSGNRNFEARIHQSIKANYLASPMLVIAFALAGRIDIDLTKEPVSFDEKGEPVYLEDLWPSSQDIEMLVKNHVKPEFYQKEYARIFDGDQLWQDLGITKSMTFAWDTHSTYIRKPPYFDNFTSGLKKPSDLKNGHALLMLADTVTTDHISPAGAIPEDYPAGKHLIDHGVEKENFNSYGSRRGNHEIMMRGTFGNIRIKNKLVSPKEGSFTIKFPGKEEMYIYDAAMSYMDQGIALIVMGGKEYGTGSSRDWAAKGTGLLGIKAVIVQSLERIHRSNLVGMGVLPLVFKENESWESLGLDGSEFFSITGIENMEPQKVLQIKAVKKGGGEIIFEVNARLDTRVDVDYFENGGILPYVLRKIMSTIPH